MKKIILIIFCIFISYNIIARDYSSNQTYDGKITFSIGIGGGMGNYQKGYEDILYGEPFFFSSLKYNWLMLGAICSLPIYDGYTYVELYPSIGATFKDNSSIFIAPVMNLSNKEQKIFQPGALIGGHITCGKHASIILYVRGIYGSKYTYKTYTDFRDPYNPDSITIDPVVHTEITESKTLYIEGGIGVSFDLHWLTF